MPVAEAHAIEEMIALARDALSSGLGKRMGAMLAQGFALLAGYCVQRQQRQPPPPPGAVEQGFLVGFAFGQIHAETLRALSNLGPLRMTPWRMMLVEDICEPPQLDGLITRPDDPLRRVVACTGAPGCSQGLAAVRPLARSLAPRVPSGKILHVSGCAKGCAHPRVADLTLVAVRDGFNFMRDARPSDPPERRHVQPEKLSELI
jgi:precorrin-3B synthase